MPGSGPAAGADTAAARGTVSGGGTTRQVAVTGAELADLESTALRPMGSRYTDTPTSRCAACGLR